MAKKTLGTLSILLVGIVIAFAVAAIVVPAATLSQPLFQSWTGLVGIGLSLVGLVVTVGGFWIAIVQIQATQSAAQAAANAVNRAIKDLNTKSTLHDIGQAQRDLEHLQSHLGAVEVENAKRTLGSLIDHLITIQGILAARHEDNTELEKEILDLHNIQNDLIVLANNVPANLAPHEARITKTRALLTRLSIAMRIAVETPASEVSQ